MMGITFEEWEKRYVDHRPIEGIKYVLKKEE